MSAPETLTGTLTIRNLDVRLTDSLRLRAARNGRSMEAEVRSILAETLTPKAGTDVNLAEAIRRRFSAVGGLELPPHPAVAIGETPRFPT